MVDIDAESMPTAQIDKLRCFWTHCSNQPDTWPAQLSLLNGDTKRLHSASQINANSVLLRTRSFVSHEV